MTPNPFPGINPYVETHWDDFGFALLNRIDAALNGSGPGALPDDLRVTVRHREVLAYPTDRNRMPRSWLEIVRRVPDGEPYTAIEVLNPVEKREGDGRVQFWRYQEEYKAAGVNRVVIDLLRGGRRPVDFPEGALRPDAAAKAFLVTVYRGRQAEAYPIDLRQRLPAFRVPLRRREPDAVLDLQSLADEVYRTGRYPIDYAAPCEPPLEADDAAWAADLVARYPR
jgi:hypothetical protein